MLKIFDSKRNMVRKLMYLAIGIGIGLSITFHFYSLSYSVVYKYMEDKVHLFMESEAPIYYLNGTIHVNEPKINIKLDNKDSFLLEIYNNAGDIWQINDKFIYKKKARERVEYGDTVMLVTYGEKVPNEGKLVSRVAVFMVLIEGVKCLDGTFTIWNRGNVTVTLTSGNITLKLLPGEMAPCGLMSQIMKTPN